MKMRNSFVKSVVIGERLACETLLYRQQCSNKRRTKMSEPEEKAHVRLLGVRRGLGGVRRAERRSI